MGRVSQISFAIVKWGVLVPLTLLAYMATCTLFWLAAFASGNPHAETPHWVNFVIVGLPGLSMVGLWSLFDATRRAVHGSAERDEPFGTNRPNETWN